MCSWSSFSWVSPFRNRRIKGYLLLPGAYRSLSRLSSALSAKASTICSFMLDQIDLCRFITQMLAPSVALIWFRFYNSFHRWNMVYRNHLVLILGHRLFSEVIQYFRCTLGCLDISSDIQCAVFKEQCLWNFFFMKKLQLWLTEQSSGKKSSFPGFSGIFSYLIAAQHAFTLRVNRSCKAHNRRHWNCTSYNFGRYMELFYLNPAATYFAIPLPV